MKEEDNKIGYYLERTTRIVKLNFHQEFKNNGINLTPEQWVILDLLNNENGLSQSILAEQSFKDAPSISRILDVLSSKGYIVRRASTKDRRKFEIFLTKNGAEIVQKAIPVVNELRARSWEGLNKHDYDTFIKIVNKVFQNFDR